jgi:ribose 5-phosphate isomerase RpiB
METTHFMKNSSIFGIACDSFSEQFLSEIIELMNFESRNLINLDNMFSPDSSNFMGAVCAAAIVELCPRGVLLVSSSGNALQIVANKFPHVRAAPCQNTQDVNESVHQFNANMCEISTQMPPFHGVALFKEFMRLRLLMEGDL